MSLRETGITLVRGTTYFTIAQIVTSVFRALTAIVLARYLGGSGYGLWVLAWSTFSIFTLFEGLPGTGFAIVRYVSKYDAEDKPGLLRGIVITSLKLQLLSIGLSCGAALLLANYFANNVFHYPQLTPLLLIYAASHFISALNLVNVLNALKKFHYQASLDILKSALRFFLITIFLITGYGIVGAAIGQGLQMVVIPLLAFSLVFTRFLPSSEPQNNHGKKGVNFVSTSKKIIVYGLPLSITGLIVSFSGNFRNFMLGLSVEGLEALGFFTIALAITDLVRTSTKLICDPLFPIISGLEAKGDREKIDKVLSTLFKNMMLFAATAVIFVELFAPQIVSLVYSEEFEPAAVFLKMLIIVTLPSVFIDLTNTLFRGIGRSDLILKINALSLLWIIPATVILIPIFGVPGAIAMILVSFLGYGLFLWIYFLTKAMRKIPFKLKPAIKLIPALGILTIALLLARPFILTNAFYLILSALLTLPASFILACFTKVITKDEIDILKSSLPTDLQHKLDFIFLYLKKIARE